MQTHTIQQTLINAVSQLVMVTDVPLLEAEILLAFVLQKERSFLYAWPQTLLTNPQQEQFLGCVARRLQREPVAYITGKKEFWSLPLRVTQATLVPRPETELLIEQVLTVFPSDSTLRVADLGTGCGAIALALAVERPGWEIIAVDINEQTLAVAWENAQSFQLKNIKFYRGDWCDALPSVDFDLMISNPPYIAEKEWPEYAAGLSFEPREALVAGEEGFSAICEISRSARAFLKPTGHIFF